MKESPPFLEGDFILSWNGKKYPYKGKVLYIYGGNTDVKHFTFGQWSLVTRGCVVVHPLEPIKTQIFYRNQNI